MRCAIQYQRVGSTLYVGLQHVVPPIIQNSSLYFSRLKRVCRTQTLTSTEHHISSLHSHFWVGSPFLLTDKIGKCLRFIIIINSRSFLIPVQTRFLYAPHTKTYINGKLFSEVCAFFLAFLLRLLKYLGLQSAKRFDHTPINDSLPREFGLRT